MNKEVTVNVKKQNFKQLLKASKQALHDPELEKMNHI